MTISPGTGFDDPRPRHGGSTPTQRLEAGDYYVADGELSAFTERATRPLSLYEQAHLTDSGIAVYPLAQVLRQVGDGVDIRPPLHVGYGYNIPIGDGFWVNYELTVFDVASVVIGANVLIGPNYSLYTAIRPSEPGPRWAKWESSALIILEDNVWLGDFVVACPGVTIGENSTTGTGAVITRDIPVNSTAVGNPARIIRNLDPIMPHAIETAGIGLIARTGGHT